MAQGSPRVPEVGWDKGSDNSDRSRRSVVEDRAGLEAPADLSSNSGTSGEWNGQKGLEQLGDAAASLPGRRLRASRSNWGMRPLHCRK